MKKILLITGIFALFSIVSAGQSKNDTIQQLQVHIMNLEKLNSGLSKQVNSANASLKKLENRMAATTDSVNALKTEIINTNKNMLDLANKLELQIQQLSAKSNSDFSVLSKRAGNNTILWVLTILLISLSTILLLILGNKRMTYMITELSDQVKNSALSVQEAIKKLENQVFWSLDFQKKLNKTEHNDAENIDHTLALKVADEIIRIQKNISGMDPGTKGLKQLEFAIERIQDNFTENGYEMVELLNKPYDQAMKVSAKFKPDNSLKPGEQIITRIIKPQVNYNNVIIQEAQVEVSVGGHYRESS
jgi:hypothetical protein